ncbi:hypothetical protein ACVR0P_06915 [Streptococcus castoreus]
MLIQIMVTLITKTGYCYGFYQLVMGHQREMMAIQTMDKTYHLEN